MIIIVNVIIVIHIAALKDTLKEGSAQPSQIFNPLRERTRDSNWVVVMKAMEVVHELMREPRTGSLKYLAQNAQMFNFSGFRSRATGDSTPFLFSFSLAQHQPQPHRLSQTLKQVFPM